MDHNSTTQTWDGFCPESALEGKTVRMRLNKLDLFESEATGLLMAIVVAGVQVVILKFRGEGKFRITPQYGDEIDNGEIISPQNKDLPPFNSPIEIFETKEEMVRYIRAIQ